MGRTKTLLEGLFFDEQQAQYYQMLEEWEHHDYIQKLQKSDNFNHNQFMDKDYTDSGIGDSDYNFYESRADEIKTLFKHYELF